MRKKNKRILSLLLVVICLVGVLAVPAFASELYDKQVTASSSGEEETEQMENPADASAKSEETILAAEESAETQESSGEEAVKAESKTETVKVEEVKDSTSEIENKEEKTESEQKEPEQPVQNADGEEKETAGTEPDPEPKPKTLDEMTDEEILIAGESMLKTAKEQAHEAGVLDITFNGDDLALWLRYQEVKKAAQATSKGRFMLKAAAAQAEIRQIYARNYGNLMNYVQAVTEEYPYMRPVGTHVHYDINTNNAVYCANINRHFVDSTIYEVAGQWKDDEMYSALSYTFDNGVK